MSTRDELKAELAKVKAVASHCLKSLSAKGINGMLDLARSEEGIPILPEALDADPWLFNCTNGTLELRTGALREHRREDYITKLAPVAYDATATCPTWECFLDRIMGGSAALVAYLRRVVGYCLTGDVGEQCLWFFHGGGQNGKSTFLGTVLEMLGDYGMQAVSDLLMVKHNESHPTERADLFGKRLVATIETEAGKRIAEALLKQLTGGDKIRARKMRQDFFEFSPTHKIILAANHKPSLVGTDLANWRRIKLVPFNVTITEQEKDKQLPAKLKAELPGVLAWAVRGCLDWQREGMREPQEVCDATNAYRAEQDTVSAFIAACCEVKEYARVKVSRLHEAYEEWSGDKLIGSKGFRDSLKKRGFASKQGHGGSYYWHGIGLLDTDG
jgi:putative DNA primase/helicase